MVTWLPASVVHAADSEMSQEDFLNLCTFLALTHDIGKLTPVFQSGISEQFPELRTRIEQSGLLLYKYGRIDKGRKAGGEDCKFKRQIW